MEAGAGSEGVDAAGGGEVSRTVTDAGEGSAPWSEPRGAGAQEQGVHPVSEAAPSAVEVLQARLSETQAALAGARALAEARADELRHDPTAERMQARNEAASQL